MQSEALLANKCGSILDCMQLENPHFVPQIGGIDGTRTRPQSGFREAKFVKALVWWLFGGSFFTVSLCLSLEIRALAKAALAKRTSHLI
jgi:hypothetical protein